MKVNWCPFAFKDNADHTTYMNEVRYIVLHDTCGYPEGDLSTLRGGGGRSVSVHFLIQPDGAMYQFMPLDVGANHAGFSDTGLAKTLGNPNHYAVGIELSHHTGTYPYPEAQLNALDRLLVWMDTVNGKLPLTRHKDIDPSRKDDPRDPFPWATYQKYRVHAVKQEEDMTLYIVRCSSHAQATSVLELAKENGSIDRKYAPGDGLTAVASWHLRHVGFEELLNTRRVNTGTNVQVWKNDGTCIVLPKGA